MILRGCTRMVFRVGKLAFKIPTIVYGWSMFLRGLLANMQEVNIYKNWHDEKLCPIIFYMPGGWLVVMPWVQEMTEGQFDSFDYKAFCTDEEGYILPVEPKSDSFGFMPNGAIVAIDYGN